MALPSTSHSHHMAFHSHFGGHSLPTTRTCSPRLSIHALVVTRYPPFILVVSVLCYHLPARHASTSHTQCTIKYCRSIIKLQLPIEILLSQLFSNLTHHNSLNLVTYIKQQRGIWRHLLREVRQLIFPLCGSNHPHHFWFLIQLHSARLLDSPSSYFLVPLLLFLSV